MIQVNICDLKKHSTSVKDLLQKKNKSECLDEEGERNILEGGSCIFKQNKMASQQGSSRKPTL